MLTFLRHGGVWLIVLAMAACGYAQATSQPATEPAASSFGSLAEVQAHYQDKMDASRRAIQAEYLAALETYLKAAPAEERADVLRSMIDSSMSLERYAQALELTGAFLADYESEADAWAIRSARLGALVELNRLDEALGEWNKATEKLERDAWQVAFNGGINVCEGLLDVGRVKDVRTLYGTMRKRFSFVTDLDMVLGPREDALIWVGREAPPIEGVSLDGQKIDWKAYKGKIVLVDFWATWCQPCLAALPDLIVAYRLNHEAGFEVVGVSLDRDKPALTSFLDQHKLPWPILYDGQEWSGRNALRYGVTAIPASFLVGRDGKIVRAGVPLRGFDSIVRRLLAEPAPKAEKP